MPPRSRWSGTGSACGTFVAGDTKGGVEEAGHVSGACHRADCSHNSALECTADHVEIGAGQDVADCLNVRVALSSRYSHSIGPPSVT